MEPFPPPPQNASSSESLSTPATHEVTPVFGGPAFQPRSVKQQSWGTVIAIVIIVVMIVVGAFYAWGKRIAEQNNYPTGTSS